MNLRQAAEQALEAMDNLHRTGDTQVFDLCHRETTEALRAALAEEALQRLTDVQQDIEAALAEPNKCTHGVTDGNCKECYMAEPDQEPLTDEELEVLWDDATDRMEHFCSQYWDFARAIEKAHGTGEKT